LRIDTAVTGHVEKQSSKRRRPTTLSHRPYSSDGQICSRRNRYPRLAYALIPDGQGNSSSSASPRNFRVLHVRLKCCISACFFNRTRHGGNIPSLGQSLWQRRFCPAVESISRKLSAH